MTKRLFIGVLVLISFITNAQYQYVGTYAGTSTPGFVDGTLTNSRFNYPYGVTFDNDQSIYVADIFNHSIRKIDLTTGTVSTLAGDGSAGFKDSIGTLAKFNTPTGVFYKNGFVYVADNLNNAIRKIDALTGEVTTVAGSGAAGLVNGPADSASFLQPKSLVVDDSGTVFVADYENHVIRKIQNGMVTTFAGIGGVNGSQDGSLATATFWRPRDITFDEYGNMYVVDLMNNKIRKISNGMVTTLAGSGSQGGNDGTGSSASFYSPTGIEYHNGELYVADGVGNKIRKITMNGTVTTIAGSGSTGFVNGACATAQFNMPQDIAMDNNGNIYVGDRASNAIRIVGTTSNLLSGFVLRDENSNCQRDSNDVGFSNWIVKAMPGSYYANTDADGHYNLPVPAGTYTLTQIVPNPFFWDTVCPSPNYSAVATVTSGTTINNLNFALHPRINCPMLTVDIGASALRRCVSTNYYYANYKNDGNDTAIGAYVDVQLDSLMSMSTSAIPWVSNTGSTYRFDVGDLAPGDQGTFWFGVYLSCDAQVGSTWCLKALIGPSYNCSEPIDSTWDHSSVSVHGVCNDSLACFTISNNSNPGNGDMAGTSEFRIYENGTLVYTGSYQLLGGQDTVICWPGNGNTIQLQADQRPMHPGHSHPNDFVEACGTPSGATPVYGIATAMSQDDEDNFVEMECLQVISSLDPNEKTVSPAGLGVDHHIKATDELEYHICFQNTGTDTAFTIVVMDTLSAYLDPATVVSGVSSNPYKLKIFGNGILQWTFSSILLPDSTTNEPGSHGFVKFKVKQTQGNVPGTLIENRVGIIFDFNTPVMTNTAFSTVWEEQAVSVKSTNNYIDNSVKVFPNPTSGIINFEMEKRLAGKWSIKIIDMLGKVVEEASVDNSNFSNVNLSGYSKGVYFYRIESAGAIINTGKVIVQ